MYCVKTKLKKVCKQNFLEISFKGKAFLKVLLKVYNDSEKDGFSKDKRQNSKSFISHQNFSFSQTITICDQDRSFIKHEI